MNALISNTFCYKIISTSTGIRSVGNELHLSTKALSGSAHWYMLQMTSIIDKFRYTTTYLGPDRASSANIDHNSCCHMTEGTAVITITIFIVIIIMGSTALCRPRLTVDPSLIVMQLLSIFSFPLLIPTPHHPSI